MHLHFSCLYVLRGQIQSSNCNILTSLARRHVLNKFMNHNSAIWPSHHLRHCLDAILVSCRRCCHFWQVVVLHVSRVWSLQTAAWECWLEYNNCSWFSWWALAQQRTAAWTPRWGTDSVAALQLSHSKHQCHSQQLNTHLNQHHLWSLSTPISHISCIPTAIFQVDLG